VLAYQVKWATHHYGIACPQVVDRRHGFQVWKVKVKGKVVSVLNTVPDYEAFIV
jgi:hypothetical protein